ncbi:MAG: hypothetical protein JNL51_02455 [Chitinophagaceae bacterium]|nr:hypothetical protein [Chitinophagaceae bacterium]
MDQEITSGNNKKKRMRGNIWAGLLLVAIGSVWLLRQSGYAVPPWVFSWEILLIILGLFVGIRHQFRDLSWLIMIVIGFVFLSDDIWPGISLRHYVMPVVIILLGLLLLFSPKRFFHHRGRCPRRQSGNIIAEDTPGKEKGDVNDRTMDIVSVFGGIKKTVLSKDFTGGEIVCIFGGAEINLMHADFKSPIVIDVVQIFGGTKLVVPANWEIRSEIAAVFGGIDDKRYQQGNVLPEKTLILKGTSIFAGIEIISF